MLVEKRSLLIPELPLQCGAVLKNARVGFETYGRLNERADNAILIAHYFTGSSHAAGRYTESDPEPGYWESVIGPGKPFDTDRYFIISCDSLSNVNALDPRVITTGPCSIDERTGAKYGASFPVVQIADFVEAQSRVLDSLGIRKLHAVAGPSMGGMQTLEWAARYPERVERALISIFGGDALDAYTIARISTWCLPIQLDSAFENGGYREQPRRGLTEALRLVTLDALHHGYANRLFGRRFPDGDPAAALENLFSFDSVLVATSQARAHFTDANSFLRTARAVQLFSVATRKDRIRAKMLFVPARSDLIFPCSLAEKSAAEYKAMGRDVETFILEGDGGHLDGLNLIQQAGPAIRRWLES